MHRHTCTHRKKQERKNRGEREINFRQHRCISINPPEYSFTLFMLVLELDCQTFFFPLEWSFLTDISQLKGWQQKHGFISRLRIVGPIPSRKVMNAIKFCVSNYRAQLLEGDEVCLLSQSHVGEKMLLKSLNWDPTQHLWAWETKGEISVSRSVLLGFNNNIISFSGPRTGAWGLHNQSASL